MHYILQHVRDSQNTKICLLLGFCFITTVIFLSRSGETKRLQMSAPEEIDEFPGEMMTGGLGAAYPKDDEVVEVVNKIQPLLEQKSGKKFESIEVLSYRPQTVAGKNYFVKAKGKEVGGDEQIMHLRIFRPIRQDLELTAYEFNKKVEDELKYFQ